MLMDEANITISGGAGGPGLVSFGKMAKSGPDGGNGGAGGDFYVVGSSDLTLLNQFSHETNFSAQNGVAGKQNKKTGKRGNDFELKLPIGTVLTEVSTQREEGHVSFGEVFEINKVGEKILIAKGGKGGKGNWEFRAPHRTTPTFAQPGLPGETRVFDVSLKLIAKFGLIGLPNAGKSSLLNEITSAKARVGAFPFTTLSPNLGDLEGKVIADIPGLIEGASSGKGLGIKFLKHIEKVETILHCVTLETIDFDKDYNTIRQEIGEYNKSLLKKPEIVVLTKSDEVDPDQVQKVLKQAEKISKKVFVTSIHDLGSIELLRSFLLSHK